MTFTGLESRYVMVLVVLSSSVKKKRGVDNLRSGRVERKRVGEWGICVLLKSASYLIRHKGGNAGHFFQACDISPPGVDLAEKKIHAITIRCDQTSRGRSRSLGPERLLESSEILQSICDIRALTTPENRPLSLPARPEAFTTGAHDPARSRDIHDPRI